MMNFSSEIKTFYEDRLDIIYSNDSLVRQIFGTPIGIKQNEKDRAAFEKTFRAYLEEAALTVSLIENETLTQSDPLLEVGGGIGMTYIFLQHKGYNIISIEPSDSGFNDYYATGKEFCVTLNTDTSNWLPLLGEETLSLGKKFKYIFSNNVLEHIPKIESTFDALKQVMSEDGQMIHNTVNYIIPYEPHFGIVLFPFFPKLTTLFKPKLKHSDMWNGLNFITTRKVRKMCRRLDMNVNFENKTMYNTFLRIKNDKEFAKRQRYFVPVVKVLDTLRLLNSFKYFPADLVTPMKFTIKHKK